jgi:hypothetical protein
MTRRTGHAEQGLQNGKDRIGQPQERQVRQNRTSRTGHEEQERKNVIGGTGQTDRAGRTG